MLHIPMCRCARTDAVRRGCKEGKTRAFPKRHNNAAAIFIITTIAGAFLDGCLTRFDATGCHVQQRHTIPSAAGTTSAPLQPATQRTQSFTHNTDHVLTIQETDRAHDQHTQRDQEPLPV